MKFIKSLHNKTLDSHIHIGQFNQHYYSPKNVITAVAQCGINKIIFSDTSAGCFVQNQKEANELHFFVNSEVCDALQICKKLNIKAQAYLWVVPEFWQYGFTLECDFATGLYSGIKLNSRTFFERYNIEEQNKIIEQVFLFARFHKLPILLHTGIGKELDSPTRFKDFFENYQDVKVTLAHCKEYETCINYFARYKNVFGDIAFCPTDAIKSITQAGFIDRLYFGTDFPVTHYFNHSNDTPIDDVPLQDLIEQYKKDLH